MANYTIKENQSLSNKVDDIYYAISDVTGDLTIFDFDIGNIVSDIFDDVGLTPDGDTTIYDTDLTADDIRYAILDECENRLSRLQRLYYDASKNLSGIINNLDSMDIRISRK